MAFDDYSYEFFNGIILNPKMIKQINESENDAGPELILEKGDDAKSVLTVENLKDFEVVTNYDEEGIVHDFGKKELKDSK